tara:strand:+ start:3977 stop:4954 length:978 start_codon:yes stop_codon:yes gene_type:complete
MPKKILNKTLQKAKRDKNDEFITQLYDVEKEMQHYRRHFNNKIILCNCDDPRISAFFHYFSSKFEKLGLKKLITACYKNQNLNFFSKNDKQKSIYLEYQGGQNNSLPDLEEINIKNLKGDGDFRSEECINLLKQADIVVTNPPFSLFKEYLSQLIKYKKKFIILGNQNAITYKEVFPLISDKKIWLGVNNGGIKWFQVPDDYEADNLKIINGKRYSSMGNIVWYTNLDIKQKQKKLTLFKKFDRVTYPEYDNFDAININKLNEIPMDYNGPMGVPITFLFKDYHDEFEILGNLGSYAPDGYSLSSQIYVNNNKKFKRLLIKKKFL